jgi:predicted nicotinamide N-methyase
VKGRTILELGSGTGLVGLIGAALGADAVWITDQAFVFSNHLAPQNFDLHRYSPLLDIMNHNVQLNKLTANVTVSELNWSASCS